MKRTGRSRVETLREQKRKVEAENKKHARLPHWKPKSRRDCESMERPCVYVSCRHNLYLDILANGHIKFNFPDKEPHEMEHSCALDLATPGGRTLQEVGEAMNLTRERVRQVEHKVAQRFRWDMRKWEAGGTWE